MDAHLLRLFRACRDYAIRNDQPLPREDTAGFICTICEHATAHDDIPLAQAVIDADNAFADSCGG